MRGRRLVESLLDTVSVSSHAKLNRAGPHGAHIFLPLHLALLDCLVGLLLLLEVLGLVHVDDLVDFAALALNLIVDAPVPLRHLVALVADVLLLGLPHLVKLGPVHLLCHGHILPPLT